MFCHEDGRPLTPHGISQAFARRAKAGGLPHVRLHDLRHSHATAALSAGIHVKVVSERLGHSNIRQTLDTYSHVIPALHETAAEQIAALVTEA